jgi:methionyl aminopeptidase
MSPTVTFDLLIFSCTFWGLPDDRPLQEGDILNIDISVFLNGVHGDCSANFAIGKVDEKAEKLIKVTKECAEVGIR